MGTKLTLNRFSSLKNDTATLGLFNDNLNLIELALANTLSRDGTSPNPMGSSLDMNSNRIFNLPQPLTLFEAARLADLTGVIGPVVTSGPATTDNGIARWNGTTGKVLKDSSPLLQPSDISAGAVTYPKIQNVAAISLLGNPTGAPATVSEITVGATLAFVGSALRTIALSGDVTTAANSFATAITAQAVTYAKLQNVAAVSLLGNSTGAPASAQEITLGATLAFVSTALRTVALSGDVTSAANSFATTIAASAVTYAKIQNVSATSRALGRNTAGAGVVEEVTLSQILDWVGSATWGDILFRGTSGWQRLAAGTPGNVLQTNGASADPTWAVASGGGGAAIVPTVDLRTASATITIPTGATKCKVTLVGGGGGSGGATSTTGCNSPSFGGPGGGAATVIKYLSGLTPGNTLALTVGAAGAAGTAGANAGGNGGDTTLASGTQTITTLTAGKGTGGAGAGTSAIQPSGAAGTGTNGDFNIPGGKGYTATTGALSKLSVGGPSAMGFGFGGIQQSTATGAAGVAGTGFGSGAAGPFDAIGGANRAGAAGTAGCAIFEWYA